jgi:Tol biopolymer transport system component
MAALLMAGPLAGQKPGAAETMMQAAAKKEAVDGDLNGAIKQYGAIVARYAKSDRAMTAKALVRMAECYQKMGDAEARKIYEQVVREYSDQKEAVAEARAHLGGAGRVARQTNTLVWSGPKTNADGTISLDGRYVSATDWHTGDLMIHDLAAGTDRYLTHTGQEKGSKFKVFAEEAAISRDGNLVAYSWFDAKTGRYELRLASASGDPGARPLYSNPDVQWLMPYDWAPDGKSIAVQLQRRDRTGQIGLVSPADGAFRALKSLDWHGPHRMFFSPDGHWLGYDMTEGGISVDRDVFVLAVDGSREFHAVEHRGPDEMAGWSPDGKWLLFTSNRTGSTDLWGLPFDDGKVQETPQLLKSGFGERPFPMGVTSTGALYYGVDKGGAGLSSIQVSSFDVETGKLTSPPTDLPYGTIDSTPTWSPDTKELAYVSERGQLDSPGTSARVFVLVVRSNETGVSRELLPKMSYFYAPNWSPDKQSFLVWGRDLQGRMGIFKIDAQTGAVSTAALVREKESFLSPVWSPDGKRFYYVRKPTGSNPDYFAFVEHDLATEAEREIIRRPVLGGLRLSPDGKYIATPSTDPSTNSRVLLLIPVTGGEPRVLMSVPSAVKPEDLSDLFGKGQGIGIYTWDTDSRSLLMTRILHDPKKQDELWRVPINGGEPRKLDFQWPGNGGTRRVILAPDQMHVAIVTSDPPTPVSTELWALENFLPKASSK